MDEFGFDDWLAETYADIEEAVTDAFGGAVSWLSDGFQSITGDFGSGEWSSSVNDRSDTYMARQGLTSESNDEGLVSSVTDKVGKAFDWMEKHKEGTKIIAGLVGGAVGAKEKRKQREAEMEQIRLQDQLKQEQAKRYSDSVSGLKTPSGMLYSGPLKYRSGNRVYDDQGRLNKG